MTSEVDPGAVKVKVICECSSTMRFIFKIFWLLSIVFKQNFSFLFDFEHKEKNISIGGTTMPIITDNAELLFSQFNQFY